MSEPVNHPALCAREVAALSDRGMVRVHNEDRALVAHTPLGELLLVCDGMGGQVGGQLAAQLATDYLASELAACHPGADPLAELDQALRLANRIVHQRGQDPALHGMGTTCVAVLVRDSLAWHGHAGDSRLYLLRYGQLRQLTRDHTRVQRLIEQGLVTVEEAPAHPDAGTLERNLGSLPEVEPELAGPLTLLPDDRLLLCSDGLHSQLDAATLTRLLAAEGSVESTARSLVEHANAAGGQDNVALVLYRCAGPASQPPGGGLRSPEAPVRAAAGGAPAAPAVAIPRAVAIPHVPEVTKGLSWFHHSVRLGALALLLAGLGTLLFEGWLQHRLGRLRVERVTLVLDPAAVAPKGHLELRGHNPLPFALQVEGCRVRLLGPIGSVPVLNLEPHPAVALDPGDFVALVPLQAAASRSPHPGAAPPRTSEPRAAPGPKALLGELLAQVAPLRDQLTRATLLSGFVGIRAEVLLGAGPWRQSYVVEARGVAE